MDDQQNFYSTITHDQDSKKEPNQRDHQHQDHKDAHDPREIKKKDRDMSGDKVVHGVNQGNAHSKK